MADEPCLPKRQLSSMGAALLAGTWPEEMNMLEPIINVLVFFDRAPKLEAIRTAFEKHVWPSHRFNCCMEGRDWVQRQTVMDSAYHFTEEAQEDEAAVDAYVQQTMFETLRTDRPRWKVIVLPTKPPSRSAVFFRLHHSIGDGLGLLFAFSPMVDCEGGSPLPKIPLPSALLPPSARRPRSETSEGRPPTSCCSCGSFMRGAMAPLLTKPDTELKFNAPLAERTPFLRFNGQRRAYRFPPISMADVSAGRKRHNCSVNDVLLAALTGALRRYGAEVCKDEKLQGNTPQQLEFKSLVMMALPRPVDEADLLGSLSNSMLFASCPLPIGEPDAETRVSRTVEACNDLKSKAYMSGLVGFTNFIKGVAPVGVLRKAASETFSKHSLLVTNVPTTTVPVTFPKEGGEVPSEVQMVFPNVVSQVSLISYNGKVFGNIVADPGLFPEMERLGDYWTSEVSVLAGNSPWA